MTSYGVVAFLSFLQVLASIEQEGLSVAAARRTYSGLVVDADGRAVGGAEVRGYVLQWPEKYTDPIDPKVDKQGSTRTQEDGRFQIDLMTPPGGRCFSAAVAVTKEGYAISGMRWAPDDEPCARVILRRPTTIAGIALDNRNEPLAGAKVSVLLVRFNEVKDRFINGQTLEPELIAMADEQGRFRLGHIDPNTTLELKAEKGGQTVIQTFKLTGYTPGQPLHYHAGQQDIRIPEPAPANTVNEIRTRIDKIHDAWCLQQEMFRNMRFKVAWAEHWTYVPLAWTLSCGQASMPVVFDKGSTIEDLELVIESDPARPAAPQATGDPRTP